MTRLSLPGDPLVQNAIEWGKQNIADLTQQRQDLADPLDQPGQAVPGAVRARCPRRPGSAPAIPDYPWIFGTDAEYTAFAAVSVGQFEAIKGHLRALRDDLRHPQRPLGRGDARGGGGRLDLVRPRLAAHQPRRHDRVRLQHRRDGQVPQHGRAAVALDR